MSRTISRLTINLLLFLFFLLSHIARDQGSYAYPSSIALAVRSPYLSCWFRINDTSIPNERPTSLNRSQTLGLSVLVRVDNVTYLFLGGVDPDLTNGTVIRIATGVSPSNTNFSGQAGPMNVSLTFLNPIEPRDWLRQSIPFSYIYFNAVSSDNASHHVQVYSDVSGEWMSGDRTQQILWNTTSDSRAIYHNITRQKPAIYTEILDQPEWGTLYYATLSETQVSFQSGLDADCRRNFTRNGMLNLQQDLNRTISDGHTVFALAFDLNNISATQAPVVWAIGYTTDPAINYTDLSGAPSAPRTPYYKTQYLNDEDMMVDFLNDFSDASSRCGQLDYNINKSAGFAELDLSSLTYFTLAEVYGSMQLTISTDGHGSLNKSDAMMFMKNIGGVKKNRVNAVETLYAAFPALMYIDPSLGWPLLEPLFRLQASRNYTIGYAAADLGSNYPNVSVSNSNHSQAVEQTGNMLIMTYAYARTSGDGSQISRYYSLLTVWADYLIASTLFTHNQSSADNLTIDNQTNLAIKGIIAIEAMSKMSTVVKQTNDTNKYSNAANSLYLQWKSLALDSDQHLLAAYGQSSESWTLGYNLFADVWLDTNLVDASVKTDHINFIDNLISSSNFSKYGLPIDNAVPTDKRVTAPSWSMFVVAITSNQRVRSALHAITNETLFRGNNYTAPAVYYDTSNGTPLQGVGSPALGALYAPFAVNVVPASTITATPVPTSVPGMTSPSGRKRNIGAIVGSVIGGVVAVVAVISITTFVKRRRRRGRPRSILTFSTDFREPGPGLIVTPFDPYSYEASQDSRTLTEQLSLLSEEPGAEMIALHRLSSTPLITFPFPQPGTPVPVGLSDKEIARLRAEGFNSQQSHNLGALPSNVSESTPSPDAAPESREAPFDPRRLHSEVESLRREIQRLHAEGLVIRAPPSYREGDE